MGSDSDSGLLWSCPSFIPRWYAAAGWLKRAAEPYFLLIFQFEFPVYVILTIKQIVDELFRRLTSVLTAFSFFPSLCHRSARCLAILLLLPVVSIYFERASSTMWYIGFLLFGIHGQVTHSHIIQLTVAYLLFWFRPAISRRMKKMVEISDKRQRKSVGDGHCMERRIVGINLIIVLRHLQYSLL